MNLKEVIEILTKERNVIEEIKNLNYKKIFSFIYIILSFIMIPIFLGDCIKFELISNVFNIFWIIFFVIIIFLSKHKNIVYSIIYNIFFICSLVQYFYISIMQKPFVVSQLFYAKEGMGYTNSLLEHINIELILYVLFGIINSLICSLILKKVFDNKKSSRLKVIGLTTLLIILIVSRVIFTVTLNNDGAGNKIAANFSKKEIYDTFIDKEQAITMTGFFEYTIREPYLYFKKNLTYNTSLGYKKIEEYFETNDHSSTTNKYTGLFKDKNLIVIMAESIDTWLIEEDVMPTVYNMQKNSINFVNRYAPFYGSGRTLNTEYSLNTGLYIPLDYNIYSARDHNYKYSLANMFKKHNYVTSSLHFNKGNFYDRDNMHKLFGYDNAYFLADMTSEYYYSDAAIIENDEYYNLMISKDNKFLTYFTTYSAHLPYNNTNPLCLDIPDSEECIKALAKHTDDAMKILIEKLERDNLLDDTVIVFVTDHYTYGYDKDEMFKIKGGNDNIHLDKIPFFIWNNNQYAETIEMYVDTQDILPTILNMFGIEYDNIYIGTDVFSNNHNNYVYFSDNTYIGEGNISVDEFKEEIEVNEWMVRTDYYNKLKD